MSQFVTQTDKMKFIESSQVIISMDNQGYPFYIKINGLTTEIISFYGNFCKSIWVTFPYIEIEVIKDWRPVGKIKGPIALQKSREIIINDARSRLTKDVDNWDEIPF